MGRHKIDPEKCKSVSLTIRILPRHADHLDTMIMHGRARTKGESVSNLIDEDIEKMERMRAQNQQA
jgi:predicted polyphosphate/ATP-dependent NAD kinase